MKEPENSGLAAVRAGPQDFDAVLQAELREILPELALPADARATNEAIDGCETDLAALCLSGGGAAQPGDLQPDRQHPGYTPHAQAAGGCEVLRSEAAF
jgi:hypothetical protein